MAAGRPLLVDVELGPRHRLYALSQGSFGGGPAGSPALPNTGALVKVNRDGTFAAMPPEDWDTVLRTDLDAFYNVVQPLVMPMVRRRKPGRIVAMSSVSGVIGNRGQVNYSAAKAGLIGAVKALALELASRAITVNAVAPGLIETDMVTPDVLERALPYVPMRRAGHPDEVAAAVTFLMSEAAGYITRQVIEISGGLA